MTGQIGTTKRESFSSIEVLSVAAIILILVMIAIPFPYASRNHTLPDLHALLDQKSVAANAVRGATLKSTEERNGSAAGLAPPGSPYEVRTVVQREFCADRPGLVRFRTKGPSCKNGTFLTTVEREREQRSR